MFLGIQPVCIDQSTQKHPGVQRAGRPGEAAVLGRGAEQGVQFREVFAGPVKELPHLVFSGLVQTAPQFMRVT